MSGRLNRASLIGNVGPAPVNASDLERWTTGATPGTTLVYHTGHLARDRSESDDNIALSALAGTAWRLADNGFLHLTQKRLAVDCYQYIATRASKHQDKQVRAHGPQLRKRAYA